MNADNLLFRASAMGDIMTKANAPIDESVTCKRRLVQLYRERVWKRYSNKTNKYVEKGIAGEDDAITLYCRVKKEMFTKNTERLTNDIFTGELDLFKGEEIRKAKRTIDIKNCWDWTTFPSLCDKVDPDYDYQGHVYMDLSGAGMHTVAYCLTNTPANLIQDEKRRLGWKLGIIDTETDEYINQCAEIEKNAIVDMELFKKHFPFFEFHYTRIYDAWKWDIPMEQRVYEMDVVRDDKKIEKMKARCIEAREWMNRNLFLIK